jgi:type I restriction enzyme S subunit
MISVECNSDQLHIGRNVARKRDHVSIVNGYPFDSERFSTSEGLPLVRIRDISNEDTEVRYSGDAFPEAMIRHGDILIGMDGDFNVARWRGGEALLNQRVCCVQPGETVDARFLAYLLPTPLKLINEFTYSTTVKHLSSFDILKIHFPLPSLDVQKVIANYLDRETARLDALVAAKERLLDLLVEKRRALITRAVTRGLDPHAPLRDSGVPWLGEIPAHWECKRAKFLFRQCALPVRDGDEMVTCFRDGQVTLRRNRRIEGFTNAIMELGYQGIRVGQLVLHSMDAFAGAIGVSDSDGKCSPEYIICDSASDETDTQYYGYLLRIMALTGFIQASCAAVRERAPRIRFSNFGEMFLPVPERSEQCAIVARIAKDSLQLDTLRAATDRTISLLKERRVAMIAAAVTGRLNVGGSQLEYNCADGYLESGTG